MGKDIGWSSSRSSMTCKNRRRESCHCRNWCAKPPRCIVLFWDVPWRNFTAPRPVIGRMPTCPRSATSSTLSLSRTTLDPKTELAILCGRLPAHRSLQSVLVTRLFISRTPLLQTRLRRPTFHLQRQWVDLASHFGRDAHVEFVAVRFRYALKLPRVHH